MGFRHRHGELRERNVPKVERAVGPSADRRIGDVGQHAVVDVGLVFVAVEHIADDAGILRGGVADHKARGRRRAAAGPGIKDRHARGPRRGDVLRRDRRAQARHQPAVGRENRRGGATRAVPLHDRAAAEGVPGTESVNPSEPAMASAALSEAIAGLGALTANETVREAAPPGLMTCAVQVDASFPSTTLTRSRELPASVALRITSTPGPRSRTCPRAKRPPRIVRVAAVGAGQRAAHDAGDARARRRAGGERDALWAAESAALGAASNAEDTIAPPCEPKNAASPPSPSRSDGTARAAAGAYDNSVRASRASQASRRGLRPGLFVRRTTRPRPG